MILYEALQLTSMSVSDDARSDEEVPSGEHDCHVSKELKHL
jgi:hypothetical protein